MHQQPIHLYRPLVTARPPSNRRTINSPRRRSPRPYAARPVDLDSTRFVVFFFFLPALFFPLGFRLFFSQFLIDRTARNTRDRIRVGTKARWRGPVHEMNTIYGFGEAVKAAHRAANDGPVPRYKSQPQRRVFAFRQG